MMKNMNRAKQSGQSITEFLVTIGLFIVPFFYGMVYLAKVGESSHKTHSAARYSAWERTVYHPSGGGYAVKTDSAIANETNLRIFGENDRIIDTNIDRQAATWDLSGGGGDDELDSMARLYERDHYDLPIYDIEQGNTSDPIADVSIARSGHPGSGVVTGAARVVASAFGLDLNNFYTATVQTPLIKSQYLRPSDPAQAADYDNEIIMPNSVNAIYTGTWNARGPSEARSRVERVLPSAAISGLNGLFNAAGSIGIRDFRNNALDFGFVDPDRVPCQRLAGSVNPSNC